jgi:undecaprenyl diphosphate synthase
VLETRRFFDAGLFPVAANLAPGAPAKTKDDMPEHKRPRTLDPQVELGLNREQLPEHVAIIMDGNGRWARSRGMHRVQGHVQGASTVREVVTYAARLQISALTLYSFSMENWKRPRQEVDALMDLYVENLIKERQTILENNIRFRQIGRRENLPEKLIHELNKTESLSSRNNGMYLVLAINYGSRQELVDAFRALARRVKEGELQPEQIDEQLISQSLYTADLPDPDLLIRTAGEMRLSNYLLWQISYAELYVTDVFWPDFSTEQFKKAMQAFAARERRFGAIDSSGRQSDLAE